MPDITDFFINVDVFCKKFDGVAKSEALKKETTISDIILMAEASQTVVENQPSYFLRPCHVYFGAKWFVTKLFVIQSAD